MGQWSLLYAKEEIGSLPQYGIVKTAKNEDFAQIGCYANLEGKENFKPKSYACIAMTYKGLLLTLD